MTPHYFDACAIRDRQGRAHYVIFHLGNNWRLQLSRWHGEPFVSLWRCDRAGIKRVFPKALTILP